MRVTTFMMFEQSLVSINRQSEQSYKLNEQVSTGRRVNSPSDDPVDSGRILGYRTLLNALDQYKRNTEQGEAWLRYTESALGEAESLVMEAKNLATQMATGTYNEENRAMMVGQAEQIYDQLMQVGNTRLVDRYIFAGFKTDTKPFTRDDDFDIAYNGDDNDLNISIQQSSRVAINTTGQAAFIDATNVFDVLKDLRNALQQNDQGAVGELLPRIDDALNQLISNRASVGTALKDMESTRMVLDNFSVNAEKLLSETEDADLVEAVTELRTREIAFEASLKSTAMVTELSLVKYV